MAIRYEGIEFDSVEELVKYKALTENKKITTSTINIQDIKKPEQKVVEEKKWRMGKAWTPEEDEIIKKYYKKYFGKERIKQNGIRILMLKIGRDRNSITQRWYQINKDSNKTDNIKPESVNLKRRPYTQAEDNLIKEYYEKYAQGGNIKRKAMKKLSRILGRKSYHITKHYCVMLRETPPKKAKTMIRNRPILPEDFVSERLKIAKKSLTNADLDFPNVYPIADSSMIHLEQMLINAVANNNKLSRFDFEHTLALQDGKEWDTRSWIEFVAQLSLNLTKIHQVLNLKSGQITIQKIDKYHYIICKGR